MFGIRVKGKDSRAKQEKGPVFLWAAASAKLGL